MQQIEGIYLSMITVPSNALPADMHALKREWNVPLVKLAPAFYPASCRVINNDTCRFEQAAVSLVPFHQEYYFETYSFLLDAISKHYQVCLKSQVGVFLNFIMGL